MKKILLFIVLVVSTLSCSSKSDEPVTNNTNSSSRNVKYEVTGNYTGKVTIVYQNQSGTMVTETNLTLPWVKEFTAEASVKTLLFNVNTTSTSTLGVSGQKVSAKLYVGGEVKKSEEKIADSNGHITIGNLIHYF